MIRNGRIGSEPQQVPPRLLPVVRRSLSTVIKMQVIGDLYELRDACVANDIDFQYVAIPEDVLAVPKEDFGADAMKVIYQAGMELGRQGDAWRTELPAFD